jgi:bifunctional non-homologous end joining protein LigD
MALETYQPQRHFDTTPEPRPRLGKAHRRPLFVIQEHHASRLHYDFRLEADGVLKSWAVPKQPSLNPAVKRLAVQVEDHPLEYANFSGEIPAGQYGAGLVHIWDKGTYENLLARKPHPQSTAEGLNAGHLEVHLHGHKLKGSFALIRMAKRGPKASWLLIKMQDAEARPDPVAAESTTTASTPQPVRSRPAVSHARAASQPPATLTFTHQDKVMFPEVGITKGEVLRFYERISTGFVASTVNQVVSKRMVKKQQMRWSKRGAHLLLQIRTRVLNGEWEAAFRTWYPGFRAHTPSVAA